MPLRVACFASKVCQLSDCADRLAHARHACLQLALDPCLIYDVQPVSSDEGMAAGSGTSLVSSQNIRVVIEFVIVMPSGEIYLRLKPYLVVRIASDVLTEHCCQICVLAMMFCRSDCRLCAGMCGKWLRNHGILLVPAQTPPFQHCPHVWCAALTWQISKTFWDIFSNKHTKATPPRGVKTIK